MTAKSPYQEFTGQVALVTGGGSGIGRAIALRYAAGGGDVAVLGRRTQPLEETARLAEEYGVRAEVVTADVRDPAAVTGAVDAVVDRLGRVDALVNNAAGNFVVPAEHLSPHGWKAVIDIVLNGTFHATRACAQHMLAAGRGAILNVIASYAESAAFLLDPVRAAYVTGDVLSVDGGQWLGKVVYADSSGEK